MNANVSINVTIHSSNLKFACIPPVCYTVADLRFPRGQSQPQREFVKKMHENERIWTEWGRISSALSLDQPLFWSVMVALIHRIVYYNFTNFLPGMFLYA